MTWIGFEKLRLKKAFFFNDENAYQNMSLYHLKYRYHFS